MFTDLFCCSTTNEREKFTISHKLLNFCMFRLKESLGTLFSPWYGAIAEGLKSYRELRGNLTRNLIRIFLIFKPTYCPLHNIIWYQYFKKTIFFSESDLKSQQRTCAVHTQALYYLTALYIVVFQNAFKTLFWCGVNLVKKETTFLICNK